MDSIKQLLQTGITGFLMFYIGFDADAQNTGPPNSASGDSIAVQSCSGAPDSLRLLSLNASAAVIDWTEPGSGYAWEVMWGTQGFNPGGGTPVFTNSKPFTLSGLTQGGQYDFYVRSICTGNDTSGWEGPLQFTAECELSLASIDIMHSDCGMNNGEIEITPQNGYPPYSYYWATGQMTSHIQNLEAEKLYFVQITDAGGCKLTLSAYVEGRDTTAPHVQARDITLYLNNNGVRSLRVGDIDDGSYDDCFLSQLTIDKSIFNCDDAGSTVPVILTGIDSTGNTARDTAYVTVSDTLPPVIRQPDPVNLYLDTEGKAALHTDDFKHYAADNCTIEDFYLSDTSFSCSDLGEHFIDITAVDLAGNQTTIEMRVTVIDTFNSITGLEGNVIAQVYTRNGYYINYVEGAEYEWFVEGGVLDNAKDNIASVTWGDSTAGRIIIVQTNSAGCPDSIIINVDLVPLSNGKLLGEKNQYTIYPNPARDHIRIELKSGIAQDIQAELYDPSGKRVITKKLPAISQGNTHQIDVSHLSSGMYIMRITAGEEMHTRKLVVR